MEDVAELVNSLGVLVAVIALSIYGVILWTFHSFSSEILQIYQTFRIQSFISTYLSQHTSLILPLLGAYVFTVFYLAGSKYHRKEGDQRNPRSNVLMEISKIVQFTMPIYIGYLLIAISPNSNTLLTGVIGLSLYGVLVISANTLSGGSNYAKLILVPTGIIALYIGLNRGYLYSELVLMSLLTLYIYLVDGATEKYYEVFTKNYRSIAENYLNVNNTTQIFLDSLESANKRKENRKLAGKLEHVMISAMKRVELIKGGNFMIFVIILTAIYTLNLSAFAVVYLLAVYPLTVVRIPLLEYRPKGPVNFIDTDYDAVFITDENDREGYYIIITPEGEKKIRADNIEGYETYSDGKAGDFLRNKLNEEGEDK